mmetsp:Transcript_15385/g.44197  ORF Transcript_15385/g.44197 Transcript_15385/m.44197 type:complete len:252 (-) Transcript_15385:408-1163(-)
MCGSSSSRGAGGPDFGDGASDAFCTVRFVKCTKGSATLLAEKVNGRLASRKYGLLHAQITAGFQDVTSTHKRTSHFRRSGPTNNGFSKYFCAMTFHAAAAAWSSKAGRSAKTLMPRPQFANGSLTIQKPRSPFNENCRRGSTSCSFNQDAASTCRAAAWAPASPPKSLNGRRGSPPRTRAHSSGEKPVAALPADHEARPGTSLASPFAAQNSDRCRCARRCSSVIAAGTCVDKISFEERSFRTAASARVTT